MRKSGIIFVVAGLFLLGAFAYDMAFVRPERHLRQIEQLDDVREDRVGPSFDPALYHPESSDVTDTRFMLDNEELDLAERGEDYQYEIRDGDTIDELARKYLGRHELKSLLFRENPQLVPGRRLEAGTRITIPFRFRR
ncbi:MAG: LysM peptidoglycan-binding domain-containing protein [Planctomycetes bacterium]|nr:LysM peptidoglycan-binding domain-containing protein [Planctomycetota bacterium]